MGHGGNRLCCLREVSGVLFRSSGRTGSFHAVHVHKILFNVHVWQTKLSKALETIFFVGHFTHITLSVCYSMDLPSG